ncbi:MAG: TorD/DmsD family molecular chaperone [Thermodesulfobacteriota bacterium]
MIEDLKEEVYLYNLLRLLFLKEPAREFIMDMAKIKFFNDEEDDEVVYGLKLMAAAVNNNLFRLDEYLADLSLEYTRLFIGPKNPPAVPFASFYLSESQSLMTEDTIEVRKRYLEAGIAVRNLYRMPDDHLGIELEFMYYLTQKIVDDFENGYRQEASRFLELRDDFLKEHMRLWVPIFAERVLEHTKEDFYKGAAYILKGVIKS